MRLGSNSFVSKVSHLLHSMLQVGYLDETPDLDLSLSQFGTSVSTDLFGMNLHEFLKRSLSDESRYYFFRTSFDAKSMDAKVSSIHPLLYTLPSEIPREEVDDSATGRNRIRDWQTCSCTLVSTTTLCPRDTHVYMRISKRDTCVIGHHQRPIVSKHTQIFHGSPLINARVGRLLLVCADPWIRKQTHVSFDPNIHQILWRRPSDRDPKSRRLHLPILSMVFLWYFAVQCGGAQRFKILTCRASEHSIESHPPIGKLCCLGSRLTDTKGTHHSIYDFN